MRRDRFWALRGGVALVVIVTGVALALDFATKLPCLAPWPRQGIPGYCYTDLQSLFVARHLAAHVFPYVHGRYSTGSAGNVFMSPGEIEYPVLTGIFAWASSLPVRGSDGFLLVSVAMLAPFGLLTSWLLARLAGLRALLFGAAPGVLLYAFVNWDLLSVALAVLGMFLWYRDRPYWAAAAMALGGCVKLWPALLLVPLVAELFYEREPRRACRAGAVGVASCLAVNVPFVALNPRGWYAPFAFQSGLGVMPGGTSAWDWVGRGLSTHMVDVLSMGCTATAVVVVTALSWHRAVRDGSFPFLQSSAAMVALYIVTAKDNSAQYVLWVLPFLVLVDISPRLVRAMYVVSVPLCLNFVVASPPRAVMLGVTVAQVAVLMLIALEGLRSRPVLVKDLRVALFEPEVLPVGAAL